MLFNFINLLELVYWLKEILLWDIEFEVFLAKHSLGSSNLVV